MYKITARVHIPYSVKRVDINEITIENAVSRALLKTFDAVEISRISIFNTSSNSDLEILLVIYIPYLSEEKLKSLQIENLSLTVESIISLVLVEIFGKINVEESAAIQVLDAEVIDLPNITIRINEEPLTAQNFTLIISALTELYTKCWLITHQRLSDLIGYTQNHDPRLTTEANLVIAKLVHNSPVEIKLETGFSPRDLGSALKLCMEALQVGIDAVTQVPHRVKSLELENQIKEVGMKQKELETKSTLADKELTRQVEAQKAEQDQQLFLIEKERKNLELLEKRLDIDKKRIEYALEIANNMVNIVNPNASTEVRAMLIQTMLPNLLQLGNSSGLQLVIPAPESPTS